VVPENVHTPSPPRKVTGNSEGEGGSKAEISEGSGGLIGSSFSGGWRNTKKLKATHD